MSHASKAFIPAFGHDRLLSLYDPLTTLFGANRARRKLVEQAALRAGHRVLDIGCGTGTLAVLIKRLAPGVEVVGLDPDPHALAAARRKAEKARLRIELKEGFADALPYPDAFFDRVFSTLMLHHLPTRDKKQALKEAARVLKPGGSLHLLDFAGAKSMKRNPLARLLHMPKQLKDNDEDRVLELMREAGFGDAECTATGALLIGRLAYYQARPTEPAGRTKD